ncbi:MAG: response regulator [Deltaproteobacteria bacterium]|nr:response regulator [Deltaproteobacteria bacterium]
MENFKVLLVDDEANVLNALRRSLRKEPYQLYLAQGPEEALDILKDQEIDLVISDHLMTAMDGLTFLKMVKNLYPQVIRIILTGHADLQIAIEAINEGEVFKFLTKPWNDIELKMTLKNIFDFIELRRENQVLLDTVQKQQMFIDKMESDHPGIFEVKRDQKGAIVLDEDFGEL